MNKAGAIINKRARYDFDINEVIRVGIVLTGGETKALREGKAQLRGAHVIIKNNELWLIGATINSVTLSETDEFRTRKLLAKKREINDLLESKEKGMTIIPLQIVTGGRYIKVDIASARGKKHHDKRQVIKQRDIDRDVRRSISTRVS